MTPSQSCPDPTRLQRLLDATSPSDEQAELMEHLEVCAGCRQRLEELAAGPESWRGVIRNLGGETGPEPARAEAGTDASFPFLDPPMKPGQLGTLAHYEILELVGRGGMGVVFKAFDRTLHRIVAVKVMAPELAVNGTARERFRREAQAAAAVCHEHIVTIHAVEEAKGLPYLVMQYVQGESLQQKLNREGPLAWMTILRLGMQTADGLAAAHAQGLIHRDIKPANILMENGVERVKITDFGLARAVDDASLTQSGVIAGTPQYMSPEQALGERQDHRTDLFSLGSVLYALCTGRPPFRADSALAILKRVAEDTPRPVRETNPEIPDWLEAIVATLMQKHPIDRFQSAAEVARLLESHLAHTQQPGQAPKTVSLPRKPVGHRRSVTVLLVVGLLAALSCCLLPVAGVMGWLFWSVPSVTPSRMEPYELESQEIAEPPTPPLGEVVPVNDATRLQGTWSRVAIEVGNKRFVENPADTLTYSGDRFTIREQGKTTLAGTFAIVDEAGEPKRMDLICTEGRHQGKRLRAIYRIQGNRLELCTDDGTDARPKWFSGADGFYRILKRKGT
jgi:serine/threonine-protein kinase